MDDKNKNISTSTPVSPSPQQPLNEPVVQPQPSIPLNSDNQVPVGLSASQLGLNSPINDSFGRGRFLKKAIIIIIVLIVIALGGLFFKSTLTGLGTKTLSNGGYTYTFKFYKSANLVQLSGGSNAYKYLDHSIAGVLPSNSPSLTNCSQIGASWTQAFTVNVYGVNGPVCTPNSLNEVFSFYFTALNHNQLFTVTYNGPQTSSVYPTLQTIFGSIKVSQ
jgi:hypothetical protein